MRPIWAGSISFGLVNIPIKLYLAAHSERFSFRMLHGKDEAPIQFKRFCSLEEQEVPYQEIVRGYEYQKGQYVVVEDQDFERIERAPAKVVDIQQFIDADELNAMFFDTPYYLEPARGAEKAYALLREALRRSGKIGIARVVLKEREYMAAVQPIGDALCMSTLRYANEIRDSNELNIPGEIDLPEKQIDLALMLVEQLSAEFHPEQYRDDYQAKVAEMIQQKLEGLPAPKKAPAAAPSGQVVDLVEVLQQSISQARGRAPEPEAAEAEEGARRAPRRPMAARSARARKRSK
jgi:DNA end-binding protein Ku